MDNEKETKVEAEQVEVKDEPKKEEPKKAAPKKAESKKAEPKKAQPKVDKKAFAERKLKAINSMSNAFLAQLQAERLMSRR